MATRTATRQGNGRGRGRTHASVAPDLELGTPGLPGQVVLVLQGGGALGAYQVGVYEALHKAGVEPDWVIGTSIGAINAALISGNRPEDRLDRLNEFWRRVEQRWPLTGFFDWMGLGNLLPNMNTVTRGIPGFFTPNASAIGGSKAEVGVEAASYYSTAPLRETLGELVDFEYLSECRTRLTVGAVNACSGHMRYFDNRNEELKVDHVMASGALPPAFAAVRVDGEPYWDGGLYSNTPIEAVLDDKPRRDSLIFAVNVWHQAAPEPASIWQVMSRQKDIQYASRADSHIARQKQIHRLRHVIRELHKQLPVSRQNDARVKELASWGCGTTMHVAHLLAPRVDGEDHTKDIDFTSAGIQLRRSAGYADAQRMIERSPWKSAAIDPIEGVIEHT
ncbi:patatin-like phospholipase family protein [Paraburkholderia hospita]|uniref:patatin-like phospholipase family protein n=1 Tax=Paraburkholderia hospita TaxID=169430 RepID=UPI003ED172B6